MNDTYEQEAYRAGVQLMCIPETENIQHRCITDKKVDRPLQRNACEHTVTTVIQKQTGDDVIQREPWAQNNNNSAFTKAHQMWRREMEQAFRTGTIPKPERPTRYC